MDKNTKDSFFIPNYPTIPACILKLLIQLYHILIENNYESFQYNIKLRKTYSVKY